MRAHRLSAHMGTMTLTLGADQPITGFIVNDLEGDQLTGEAGAEPGLQLPYLDVDAPGFAWPTHAPVGLPPRTPLVPADRVRADNPGVPVQVKRNRDALRGQGDVNPSHPEPTAALPSRKSLRHARAAEPATVVEPLDLPAPWDLPELPEDTSTEERDRERAALADDLEAALNAALEAEPDLKGQPSRKEWFDRAEALAVGIRSGQVPESEYMSMLKSYGPFPLLRPAPRDFRPLLVLSVLFGFLGADRFYRGRHASGALKLLTAGGLGIWWIFDIVAILRGKATDKAGRRFNGDRTHRIIAGVLAALVIAGLIGGAVTILTPASVTTASKVVEAVAPKPAPVLAWAQITSGSGSTPPGTFTVSGDRLRLTYKFAAPVYVYLQEEGNMPEPSRGEALLLKETPSEGVTEIPVTPGTYHLKVVTEGSAWTVAVEDLDLRHNG